MKKIFCHSNSFEELWKVKVKKMKNYAYGVMCSEW